MFGDFELELEWDADNILEEIVRNLKKEGISYRNNIEGNILRGFGDAGIGLFVIEKKTDKNLNSWLVVKPNSATTAQILRSIIELTLEELEQESEKTEQGIPKVAPETDSVRISLCSSCKGELVFTKKAIFLDMKVEIFTCNACGRIEFYRVEEGN